MQITFDEKEPMGIVTFNPADPEGLEGMARCLEDLGDPILLHWEDVFDPGGDSRIPALLEGLLRHPQPVYGLLPEAASGPNAMLLLACDTLYWAKGARWRLALHGFGEVTLLTYRLGETRARRAWFGGGLLTFGPARDSGWAQRAPDDPKNLVRTLESELDKGSSRARGLLRPLLYHQAGLARLPAEALERYTFASAFQAGDLSEGIAAFLERRKPDFEKGKG